MRTPPVGIQRGDCTTANVCVVVSCQATQLFFFPRPQKVDNPAPPMIALVFFFTRYSFVFRRSVLSCRGTSLFTTTMTRRDGWDSNAFSVVFTFLRFVHLPIHPCILGMASSMMTTMTTIAWKRTTKTWHCGRPPWWWCWPTIRDPTNGLVCQTPWERQQQNQKVLPLVSDHLDTFGSLLPLVAQHYRCNNSSCYYCCCCCCCCCCGRCCTNGGCCCCCCCGNDESWWCFVVVVE